MAEQQTGHEQTLILVRFLKTAVGTASYICGKGLRVDIRLVGRYRAMGMKRASVQFSAQPSDSVVLLFEADRERCLGDIE